MAWKFFESGVNSAEKNMRLDLALLEDLKNNQQPLVHFYDWEQESLTYGHFIQPEKHLDLNGAKKWGLQMAKRPTGGGIVFHNCDFAFSVLVPKSHPHFTKTTLENYAFINTKVKVAIGRFLQKEFGGKDLQFLKEENEPLDASCTSFCMAKPTKYDVMLEGQKVGGSAQRMTKFGYLHQGSILLGGLSEEFLHSVLLPKTRVAEGMQKLSFPLLGQSWTKKDLLEARAILKRLITQVFNE